MIEIPHCLNESTLHYRLIANETYFHIFRITTITAEWLILEMTEKSQNIPLSSHNYLQLAASHTNYTQSILYENKHPLEELLPGEYLFHKRNNNAL